MINIKRESGYSDKLRTYKVELDGAIIGEIADGQNRTFKVEPGVHTLCLKIDWARSNQITFNSSSNKTIQFICSSRMKGLRSWLAVIYLILLPHKYIALEQVD